MIKLLTYITKINKHKKENKSLLRELMKNLKLSFDEENNCIKYDEYFFNGIQIPKDIEFKDISLKSCKLFWKIDNLNIININNNEIKYKVEIRKENINGKFIQVYEGKDSNCIIDNLNGNTNYEIRICSFYNNLRSFWSNILKIKTNDFDSVILDECNNKKEFIKKILEWSGCQKMELLYRGSRDGTASNAFHNKCDNKGATICLYKNEKGYIFGGYSPISWKSDGGWNKSDESFIFTLTNIHGTKPTKFPHINGTNDAIYHAVNYGPTFNDFYIYSDYSIKNCSIYFSSNFKDVLNKGKSIFSGDLNNDINETKIKEIEVFHVFK